MYMRACVHACMNACKHACMYVGKQVGMHPSYSSPSSCFTFMRRRCKLIYASRYLGRPLPPESSFSLIASLRLTSSRLPGLSSLPPFPHLYFHSNRPPSCIGFLVSRIVSFSRQQRNPDRIPFQNNGIFVARIRKYKIDMSASQTAEVNVPQALPETDTCVRCCAIDA